MDKIGILKNYLTVLEINGILILTIFTKENFMRLNSLLIVEWYLSLDTGTLLLINWICTGLFLLMAFFFGFLWLRAELKLARHNESKLFNNKKKNKK